MVVVEMNWWTVNVEQTKLKPKKKERKEPTNESANVLALLVLFDICLQPILPHCKSRSNLVRLGQTLITPPSTITDKWSSVFAMLSFDGTFMAIGPCYHCSIIYIAIVETGHECVPDKRTKMSNPTVIISLPNIEWEYCFLNTNNKKNNKNKI